MAKLQDITTISNDVVELFEAVGYFNSEDLVAADVVELHSELVKANETLGILPEPPEFDQIKSWQDGLSGVDQEQKREPVAPRVDHPIEPQSIGENLEEQISTKNFEEDHELLKMLENSPTVELLSGALVRQHQLTVKDIPEGILLTNCRSDLEINVMSATATPNIERGPDVAERTGLMTSRIRNFDQADVEDHVVKPLERGAPREAVSVSEGLNRGVSPESRRFIRGVLNPEPVHVQVSAFFAVMALVSIVLVLIGAPLAILYEYHTEVNMLWWIIGLVAAVLVSGMGYLIWSIHSRCRICGQKYFTPKKCLKHVKAHHIPLIGYILPTALHVLFFKWFYCTYCGTAVRMKK